MLTVIISFVLASIIGYVVFFALNSLFLSILAGLVTFVGINFLIGRKVGKKLTSTLSLAEKDASAERYELAIDKLKSLYPYGKWQFLVSSTIDGQIGVLYYVRKKFEEAKPFLEKSNFKNWQAKTMLASYYYKTKQFSQVEKIMEKTIASNKTVPFVYSLAAYFYSEQGQVDKAIAALNKGVEKNPLDKRLSSELDSIRSNKKIKIQNYGILWLQLHLGKAVEGAKQYQMFLANQKIRRR